MEAKRCKCGGEAMFIMGVQTEYYWIFCNECHKDIHPVLTKEDAVEIWNAVN